MDQPTQTCKNCDKDYQEGFAFCPHCGQKTKVELTLGLLFYNTISNYFSFDARFFKSFIPLMFKPGYLAKRFIEGKRLLYLHPAQLYLFVSVLFFFLMSFSVRKQVQSVNQALAKTLEKPVVDTTLTQAQLDSIQLAKEIAKFKKDSIAKVTTREALLKTSQFTGLKEADIDSIVNNENFKTADTDNLTWDFNQDEIDSLIAIDAPDEVIFKQMGMNEDDGAFKKRLYAQTLRFYKSREGGSILQTFYDTIPIAMFFLLPIFALLLKIFYFNRGQYAHHLVFSFYYFSFLFAVFCIILGVNMIFDLPDWIDWLVILSTYFYLFMALKKFYQQGWFLSFFKVNAVSFGFLIFVIPVTAFILLAFAFMFY
ncbi:MAG: DUF3667 domain-containing protein [Croceitalea sp.]|nr:DUF3667 domain-containing protein [Croceitalea sp.]